MIRILILSLLLAGCGGGRKTVTTTNTTSAEATPAPLRVEVAKAARLRVSHELALPGTVVAHSQVNVTSEVSARVLEVRADFGDRVSAGEPLIVLDPGAAELDLRQSRAQTRQSAVESGLLTIDGRPRSAVEAPNVVKAKAALENSQQKYKEYRELRKEELISDQSLSDVRQDYLQAKADYQAAVEQVERGRASVNVSLSQQAKAEYNRGHYVISSPIDGTVLQRTVQPGDFLSPGQSAGLTLVSLRPVYVMLDVPQQYALELEEGETVSFVADAAPKERLNAVVRRLSPAAGSGTRAFQAKAEVLGPPPWLKPGMAVQSRLALQAPSSKVIIPDAAVLSTGEEAQVFVVEGDRVRARRVKTGRSRRDWVEVENLKPGERVVTSELVSLQDGSRIQVERELSAPPMK